MKNSDTLPREASAREIGQVVNGSLRVTDERIEADACRPTHPLVTLPKSAREIAKNKRLLKGLMPENRDNPYPAAEKLLKAFQGNSVVVTRSPDGRHKVRYPKLRPIQRQILDILATLPPNPV